MEDSKRIAIAFYTGEYAGMLEKALSDADCWHREVDRMTFEDGYEIAREDAGMKSARYIVGGSSLDEQKMHDSWGKYLRKQIEGKMSRATEDYYIFTEVSPLDMAATVIFTWAKTTKLFEAANRYAAMLRATDVGGDDDTFDYFPDAMEALYQLCRAVGGRDAQVIYEQTRQAAWDKKYKELGEADNIDQQFPKWEAAA